MLVAMSRLQNATRGGLELARSNVGNARSMTNAETRLLVGSGMILLAISLVNGFLIEMMPLVRLALSAHLVGLMGSAFLIGLGATWHTLGLTRRTSRIAALAAVYGFCGGWFVYFIAAATSSGGMFPIASGHTRGSLFLESVMSGALLTVALALFTLCGIILKGLSETGGRGSAPRGSEHEEHGLETSADALAEAQMQKTPIPRSCK